MRVTEQNTLELSGQIIITGQRLRDEAVLALLPEDYRPAVACTVPVASNIRKRVWLAITPSRRSDRSPRGGKYLQVTWISLDGAACRLDAPDEVD